MRLIPHLALAAVLLPLTGCPGDDSSSDDTTTAPTTTATDTGADSGTAADSGTDTGADSGTGSMPSGGFCLHQCEGDADCLIMGAGDLTCNDGFCTGDVPSGCTDDQECQAQYSGWITPCTSGGGECEATAQLCVDVGGTGLCATPPTEFVDCATLMQDEVTINDIDGMEVTVCGNTTAACGDNGVCFDPCQSDADCVSDAAPVCNTGTGFCECGEDSHCATLGMPHLSVCNAGACGCGADQDCVDGSVGDVCNDGSCGCTADMACDGVTNPFDGGTIACVEL